MFKIAIAAFAVTLLLTPARAQNIVANQFNANTYCGKQQADATGCALLAKPKLSPFSAIRTAAAHLWDAKTQARKPDDRLHADELFDQLQDAVGSQQKVRKLFKVGPDNAGVLIETAVIARLKACASGPCEVLSAQGKATLRRVADFLGQVYPEKAAHWALLKQASAL